MKWIKTKSEKENVNFYKKNKNRTYTLNLKLINDIWVVDFYVWESFFQSGIEYTILHIRKYFRKRENAIKKLYEFKKIKV